MDIEATMTNETKQRDVADRIIRQAGLGNRLRSARETMRISEKDAAARLHLNSKIITILENEEFENGPPDTFLRGYIRSYAKLLNIPDSEICAALTQMAPPQPIIQPNTPLAIMNTRPNYNSHRYLRSMTYVVVAMLVILVSVWWTSHPRDISKDMLVSQKVQPVVSVPVVPVQSTTTPVINASTSVKNSLNPIPVENPKPVTQVSTTPPVVSPTSTEAPVVTVPPPTTAQPKSNENIDDMDMALSDPTLEQNDENDSKPNTENNNNTHE